MSIIQISKIQHRSGNIVDLPQLDEAELGFASDTKQLFIGKNTPNENIEVLTSYSNISFSQIDGAVGNINIDGTTVASGQVLSFDGISWVNKGGNAEGLITLGDVSNVKITGGAIGYVLETDGTGNLSWTPKSTILVNIKNVTNADPAVVTTVEDNFLIDGAAVTITNVPGMTQLNGNSYYADILTSNTFSLYSDSSLTTSVDSTGYSSYSYTTASATDAATSRITVGSSAVFSLNDPIVFSGTTFGGVIAGVTYYVKTKPTSTTITISETLDGTVVPLESGSGSCEVYVPGGRGLSVVGGTTGTTAVGAAGSNTTIQFNTGGILAGDASFTWNTSSKTLAIGGNINVSDINASANVFANRFVSNVATGTAPLIVNSITRVANLNVAHSNVSDFSAVTTQSTGSYFLVLANGSGTANRALAANANLGFTASTGNLSANILYANTTITAVGNISGGNLVTSGSISATGNITGGNLTGTLVTGTLTTAAQPNITSTGTLTSLSVTGNITGGNLTGTLVTGTLTTAAQPNITSTGTLTSLSVTGNTTTGGIKTDNYYYANGVAINFAGTYSNSNVAAYLPTYAGNIGGTLITNSQPNITTVGTLGNLVVSGNIGIGVSPTQKLDVSGSVKLSGAIYENVFTITDGSSVDLNPVNGTIQLWTLGSNRTPTATNFAPGQSITLMVIDGTNYTINWTSIGVVWKTNAGLSPTLNTSGYTAIILWKVASTVYGARVGDA